MNDFLKDVFTDLDANSSVRLAQISSIFASVFFSKRFWQLRASEYHLQPEGRTINEIINEIRRFRNKEQLPQYLICSYIKIPDTSFKIVDFYVRNERLMVLFENGNDTWMEAVYQSCSENYDMRVPTPHRMYKGIIWKNGEVDKDKINYLKNYPVERNFILLESREWKGYFIRYHEHLFETTWPFNVYNWRTKSYSRELQKMIQSIGEGRHITHVQFSGKTLCVISQSDGFALHILRESEGSVHHVMFPCEFPIPLHTEIFFSVEYQFWCFRDQNSLIIKSLQV